MAKLRIFVSSTYYDLKHVRASLEPFIKNFDYQPVHFERNDICYSPDRPLDESCYQEIENCDMQILIIGGNYGSSISKEKITPEEKNDQYKTYKSVTRKEFEVAIARNIPVYIFVEENVMAEYGTYKENRENYSIRYAHGNPNIFIFLDYIYELKINNYVQKFATAEDIINGLKAQWSHLFRELLANRIHQRKFESLDLNLKILSKVTSSLHEYSEAILEKVDENAYAKIKSNERSQKLEIAILNIARDRNISELANLINVRPEIVAQTLVESKTHKEFDINVRLLDKINADSYMLTSLIKTLEFRYDYLKMAIDSPPVNTFLKIRIKDSEKLEFFTQREIVMNFLQKTISTLKGVKITSLIDLNRAKNYLTCYFEHVSENDYNILLKAINGNENLEILN